MLSCIIYILFCYLQYAAVRSFDRHIVINLSSYTMTYALWHNKAVGLIMVTLLNRLL